MRGSRPSRRRDQRHCAGNVGGGHCDERFRRREGNLEGEFGSGCHHGRLTGKRYAPKRITGPTAQNADNQLATVGVPGGGGHRSPLSCQGVDRQGLQVEQVYVTVGGRSLAQEHQRLAVGRDLGVSVFLVRVAGGERFLLARRQVLEHEPLRAVGAGAQREDQRRSVSRPGRPRRSGVFENILIEKGVPGQLSDRTRVAGG